MVTLASRLLLLTALSLVRVHDVASDGPGDRDNHETLWAHPLRSKVHLATQRSFDRRRAMPQALRIKIDATFIDYNNADAQRFTCFRVGQRVLLGAAQSPTGTIPRCEDQTEADRLSEYFCFAACEESDVLTRDKRDYLVDRLMRDATAYFSTVLRIEPSPLGVRLAGDERDTPTVFPCSAFNVDLPIGPSLWEHPDFDMVLFVTASPVRSLPLHGTAGSVGFARYCAQDSATLRPIAGLVNIGPNAVSLENVAHTNQLSLILHEITHALGFTYELMWQLANLGRFELKELTGEPYSSKRVFVSTPAVTAAVRDHFNCSTLVGAQLEDGYGSGGGTAGSHWEERLFGNEYMTGIGFVGSSVKSKITLALFDDLGFYRPDYTQAETLIYGASLGCSFATQRCADGVAWRTPWLVSDKVSQTAESPYFCTAPPIEPMCTFDRGGRMMCAVSNWSSLPPDFSYFSGALGGSSALADMCPIGRAFANGDCSDTRRYDESLSGLKAPLSPEFSSHACPTCRCFTSSLTHSRSLLDYGSSTRLKRADCFDTMCVLDRRDMQPTERLLVFVAGAWIECPKEGGVAKVDPSLFDKFECAKVSEICPRDSCLRQEPSVHFTIPAELPLSGVGQMPAGMLTLIGQNFHSIGETLVEITLDGGSEPLRLKAEYVSRTALRIRPPVPPRIAAPNATVSATVAILDSFGRKSVGVTHHLTFVRDWPVLSAVMPSSGRLDGGDVVTLLGAGFYGACYAYFDGVASPKTIRISMSTVTAIVPRALRASTTTVWVQIRTQPHNRSAFGNHLFSYTLSADGSGSNEFLYWWAILLVVLFVLSGACLIINREIIKRYGAKVPAPSQLQANQFHHAGNVVTLRAAEADIASTV